MMPFISIFFIYFRKFNVKIFVFYISRCKYVKIQLIYIYPKYIKIYC